VNDEVVSPPSTTPDAVAGRIRLRLRLVASSTWPGILDVAVAVATVGGGAGSGSRLIVVVVGGIVKAVPPPTPPPPMPNTLPEAELLMDMPSGPRTVAVAE